MAASPYTVSLIPFPEYGLLLLIRGILKTALTVRSFLKDNQLEQGMYVSGIDIMSVGLGLMFARNLKRVH